MMMMMMTSDPAPHQYHQPPSPPRWVTLCQLNEITPGRAKYVEFEDRAYSVVRTINENSAQESEPSPAKQNTINAEVQIFADACPHAGASMSYGCIKNNCFVCPAHQWAFQLTDGKNPENPEIILQTYPCRVNQGAVQIGLPY